MDEERLKSLAEQYGYGAWRGNTLLGENLFVWRFYLVGNEFPGWQAHRIQSVDAAGWPPSIQSIWGRVNTKDGPLLSINITECASALAAREILLTTLGDFQSPLVARHEPATFGDVTFGMPGETAVLFARANLVVLFRNAGRSVVQVRELAQQFDEYLSRRPEAAPQTIVPVIQSLEAATGGLETGRDTPLEVKASDPLGRPIWFKFFSGGGLFLQEDGHVFFRPVSAGPQQVTVFAINANAGAASQTLELSVK